MNREYREKKKHSKLNTELLCVELENGDILERIISIFITKGKFSPSQLCNCLPVHLAWQVETEKTTLEQSAFKKSACKRIESRAVSLIEQEKSAVNVFTSSECTKG